MSDYEQTNKQNHPESQEPEIMLTIMVVIISIFPHSNMHIFIKMTKNIIFTYMKLRIKKFLKT